MPCGLIDFLIVQLFFVFYNDFMSTTNVLSQSLVLNMVFFAFVVSLSHVDLLIS